MYTGRQPTVDSLLTVGCRLTPKKSTSNGPALNPNPYGGIFLGYRATMDNIIYWDTNAQRVRTANITSMTKCNTAQHQKNAVQRPNIS
jgi:hypothetical protein